MSIVELNRKRFSPRNWLGKQLLVQKMNNPFGYALAGLIALGVAFLFSLLSVKLSFVIVLVLVAIPVVIYAFIDLNFGISLAITLGFFIEFIKKYAHAPVGTAIDGLLMLMLVSVLVRLIKERNFDFVKSPITIFVVLWIYYNLLQVMNPTTGSRMAWLYTVRTVAIYISMYFVAAYAFKNLRDVINFIKLVLGLAILSALYSLKQEHLGYSSTEMAWLYEDPERFELIYQWGRLRVFSFFSDPTTFGILMAYMAVFSMVLAMGPYKTIYKVILLFGVLAMLMGMAYGGSRTPVVLVPIGVIFFAILTFNKRVMIGVMLGLLFGGAMMMKSTSNATIYRIQSAFHLKDDASVVIRMKNQKRIQPLVQTHPFGLGLGSTGAWARRFTPKSWLAHFAHDSLFVRIAVEAGWLGLLLYMALLFVVVKTGIKYYFRVRDPVIKNLYLAMTTAIFILTVASYPQEAITILPNSLVFYVMLGALVRLKDFDVTALEEPEKDISLNKQLDK